MTLRFHFNALLFIVLFGFICLMPPNSVRAQNGATYVTGAFEGDVTDNVTKAPVADATVQIINKDTGVPAATRTNSQGHFSHGLLSPGDYIIRVSRQGYAPYETVQVLPALRPTRVVPVPVRLTPEIAVTPVPTETPAPVSGQPSPQPTPVVAGTMQNDADRGVSAEVNTTDGQRGDGFNKEEVSTLPLGSTTLTRTFDELGLLLPGVTPPPQTLGSVAGPGVGPGVGSAGQFSVNGLRSRANNFTVDGSDNNDEDIGVRRQGFFALVPQPIESIQEFHMITLLAPAQYGRNMGAQVNAISKSGGNDTHGAAYGFLNFSQLNARNAFDGVGSAAAVPLRSGNQRVFVDDRAISVSNGAAGEDSFSLGQGGLVLGGPLVPNKMFYFLSAEGHVLNATKEESFAVPTVAQRGLFNSGASGLFFTPFHDINGVFPIGSSNAFFPTAFGGDAIFSLFPFPNNPNGVYGANTFTQQLPASAEGRILSGKVDAVGKWRGRTQSFTARYNFTQDWRDIPVTGQALFSTLRPRVRTQNFSTFWNSEISSPGSSHPLLNQLRASYGRTRLIFDENRDRTFLLPSQLGLNNPEDERFLLNAPFLSNFTLPAGFGVPNTGPVDYFTFTGTDVQDLLGPVGQVAIAGFSPVGVDVFNFPQRRVNNTYQLADTITWSVGSGHNLTFGTDIRRTELISDLPRNSRPLITFNGTPRVLFDFNPETGLGSNFRFGNFLTGLDLAAAEAPTGFFQSLQLPGTSSYLNLRYYQYNFFGQDQWRIRPNLSLSLGLRYEYNTPPTSANDQIEQTFTDSRIGSLLPNLRTFIDGRTNIFDPDKTNFAPRVSFAWSPRWSGQDSSTVIRGGYGLYYDQILGAVVSQSRNVFPNVITANLAGGAAQSVGFFNIINPSDLLLVRPGTLNTLDLRFFTLQQQIQFLQSLGSGILSSGVSGITVTLPDRQLKTPMAHHYGLTVDQQLGRSLLFSAGYVGTRGRDLLRATTPNLGPNAILAPLFTDAFEFEAGIIGAVLSPGSRVSSSGVVSGGRPVSGIGPVTIYETSADSRYDALQLQLRGRYNFLGSTQFQVNYTFSKVTDDVSDVFDLAGASALPQNSLTFAGERGPANFDVRHRVAGNYITDLSSWGKHGDFMHAIFSGLEVAGTSIFQTGQPFTVNSIFDVNLDGNLTDRPNTAAGIQETGNRAQPLILTVNPATLLAPIGSDGAVPRNSFRSGNLFVTNAAVIKTFSFSEQTKLVFRTEAFNLFNRANYGIPVRFLESPGFGRATETLTPGRRLQFGLKVLF
jgi:Carboxypeptidase regulatory-like domain/TonB dependent receptor